MKKTSNSMPMWISSLRNKALSATHSDTPQFSLCIGKILHLDAHDAFSYFSYFIIQIAFLSAFIAQTTAQSITLTSPATPVSTTEGDDFATQILKNPWDLNERRDIGFEQNFIGSSIRTENGAWKGTQQGGAGYVFPLFGGYLGTLPSEGPPGDKELPRFGVNHPIDANRYFQLSIRLKHSARSTYAIYWNNDPSQSLFPDGSLLRANFDGMYLDRAYTNSDFQIYTWNLKSTDFDIAKGAWTGLIRALRIDPSTASGDNATTEIDWIRLVDPNSALTLPIQWQDANLPVNSLITIYADTNNSGYDGTPIATYVKSGGTGVLSSSNLYNTRGSLPTSSGIHYLRTASLPPGTYSFYVTARSPSGGNLLESARSNYSAPLTILASPIPSILAPSTVSGADYASQTFADSWDMTNELDISNLPNSGVPAEQRQYSNSAFINGIFQATADAPYTNLGNKQSDVQVHMRIPIGSPISTNRFRYLSYRMGADDSLYPTIQEKIAKGWVSRPIFWNQNVLTDGGSSKAHILYEGLHTYVIDLWDPQLLERGIPWQSAPFLNHLRLDPLETSVPTWFFIDDVRLTAENIPTNNQYQVVFTIDDVDSLNFTGVLYQSPNSSGAPRQQIASLSNLHRGQNTFTWDTNSLPSGNYYLTLQISDSAHSVETSSLQPVRIGLSAPSGPQKAPFDYDADGMSDPVVFRKTPSPTFFVRASSAFTITKLFGSNFGKPLHGDFDGDGKADFAYCLPVNGSLFWFEILSSTGGLRSKVWGYTNDLPVVADYNGDGKDDIAIYRDGFWYVLYDDNSSAVVGWGRATDIALPEDYDGDGRADVAIWRPEDGMWWIFYSGYLTGHANNYYAANQWGLPGDIPVPGDYDADGKTDYAVWRPSEGNWYIRNLSKGIEVTQWGLPGDVPVVGDFTGDGILDLTVWRPSNGTWYINNRGGSLTAMQWGLPGDVIPDGRKSLK